MSSGLETSRDFQVGLSQAWHRSTIVEPVISKHHFPVIVAAPLTYVTNGELKPWPGMSVPVSTDDGLPVGTAFGASYALFTPQDAMTYLEEVLSGTGYKVVSLGMIFNRSRWFVSFELVELAGIAPAGESFILSASGGLDKSQSPMFNLCHVVQVCANTVRLARAGRALFSSKLTKGFSSRLEASRAALADIVGMARVFNETLRGLDATRATVDDARAVYAAELTGNGADLRSTRSGNLLDDMVTGFRSGRGNSGATRLDVVNGFTEVMGQGLAGSASKRDAFSRWESSEWGGNADRKAAFVDGITAPGGWDSMVSIGNGAMADARRNTVTVA
jgi:hypothetical protein